MKLVSQRKNLDSLTILLLMLVPNLLWLCVVYPGYLQADHQISIASFALGHPREWHSLLWCLFAFPFLYWSPSIAVYGVVQIVAYVALMMFSIKRLQRIDIIKRRGGFILATVYGFFPTFVAYNQLYSSDVMFAYILVPITVMLMEVYKTSGECLKSIKFSAFFCLFMYLACELRKNAILIPVIAACVLLLIYKPVRKRLAALFAVLLASLLATSVFFSVVLQSEASPSQEMLSVPAMQIARVYVDDGDIPDSVRKDLEQVRSADDWKSNYVDYLADYEKKGLTLSATFIKDWLILGLRNPSSYIQAYQDLMYPYWQLTVGDDRVSIDFQNHDDFTIGTCGNQCRAEYVSQFKRNKQPSSARLLEMIRIANEEHYPFVNDFYNLIICNRALPL